jgi:hypothetical protein
MTRTKHTFLRSRIFVHTTLLFASFLFAAIPIGSHRAARKTDPEVPSAGNAATGRQPFPGLSSSSVLKFVKNEGQATAPVRFVSHGSGYELFLLQQEAVLALSPARRLDLSPTRRSAFFRERHALRKKSKPSYVRVHLVNSNPETKITGVDPVPGRTDYFLGQDPTKWRTNVPSFSRVKYTDVYPGVDLVFYGNQRRLEYDFIVAPGADPKAINLSLEGARNLRLSSHGDLLVSISGGEVAFQKPVVYQESHGQRREIESAYALGPNHRVNFSVGEYDRNSPLIVDPVLVYSTYLGGEGDDSGQAIALDSAGNAVIAGSTLSLQFPTTAGALTLGPLSTNANGVAFVTKIDPTGANELYSSYIGGSGGDFAFAVALDALGNIYVTGETDSTDFPTTPNALKAGPNAANANGTSFVFKINPTLTGPASLLYSSYLGGTQSTITEMGNGIATDANGLVYVVGLTASQPGLLLANFPVTAAAFQSSPGAGIANGTGFLAKLDTTQSGSASLIYSTYLGGNGVNASGPGFGDSAFSVAEDSSGKTYLAGTTTSTDFPTTPTAFQQAAPAAIAQGTVFVTSLDTTISGAGSLLYSSYLGGEAADFGDAIALGPSNTVYLTGSTSSLKFPTTPGAFQTTGNQASIAFITLIDPALSGNASLKYSTFLGGSQTNTAVGIAADSSGNAYVVGSSQGADFPTTPTAIENVPAPGSPGAGFVTKLNPGGQGAADLLYSTYFGGSGANGISDEVNGLALNSTNYAFVTGDTVSSTGFPVTPNPGAFQTSLNGPSDAFVAALTFQPVLAVSPASLTFGNLVIGTPSAAQTVTLTNNSLAPIGFTSATISGGAPAAANSDFSSSTTCSGSIAVNASCIISVLFTPSVASVETANLVITDTSAPGMQTVALTGTGIKPNFTLTASPTTVNVSQGETVAFNVTVTPTGGFNAAIALACSGAPAMSTCTISPSSVTPSDGMTPVVATVSVATVSPSFVTPGHFIFTPPPSALRAILSAAVLLFTFFLFFDRRRRLSIKLSLMTAAFGLVVLLAGCGNHHTPTGGTPTGSSTLTITGTSGSLTNSTSVTLTVN